MVIDVHCHTGYSARRIDPAAQRFAFERNGAAGRPGYDSYFSPRMMRRTAWYFVKRWLAIDTALPEGDKLDAAIDAMYERHWSNMPSVDRLVLLAFDEYRDDRGLVIGPARSRRTKGTDLYVSNSLVRAACAARPDRYLFGASIHPYRVDSGMDACDMLAEVASTGAALVKWLPIHQNIRADDPRTIAFLRRAAELRMPMLIHYGGEMSLARQHMEFESPVPMLGVLRRLRAEGRMPTVIVAHVATPSFPWQDPAGCEAFLEAMLGEFADAPLYADISALAAFGRTSWLRRLARRPELHEKLLWGSDFPIPVLTQFFWRDLPTAVRTEIQSLPSWIEQDIRLKRALGFGDRVFTHAAEILRPPSV